MDFGKVSNLSEVDFTLPEDPASTVKLLAELGKKKKKTKVYIGLAKWGIPQWVGTLYPPKTKAKDFRPIYLTQYDALELNAVHYQLPNEATAKSWKKEANDDFKFSPKFHQSISHWKRLNDCQKETDQFYSAMDAFGNNLGAMFLQLPPNYPPKNAGDIENYIKTLPKDIPVNLELRHPKWFEDTPEMNDFFEMLKANRIGTVITDTAGRRDVLHMRLTSPVAFIRFVGNNLDPTDYKRIDDWVKRMKKWVKSGMDTIYFYMHMHDEKDSPQLSVYLIEQINKHCGTKIKVPEMHNNGLFG
jgi:uncharacterized protein YecE (DUF72 family)